FGDLLPVLGYAVILAVISAGYTILGGLRAVAVMDTYSGIGILGLALLIVFLALAAVDFDPTHTALSPRARQKSMERDKAEPCTRGYC
ncbi:MAG: hypothetical protein AAFY12_17740, partial [Pseudomonadota bacterium]